MSVAYAAFAAIHDPARRPDDHDLTQLRAALAPLPADGLLRRGALALAWCGGETSAGDGSEDPVIHVHGSIYDPSDVSGGSGAPAAVLGLHAAGMAAMRRLRGDFVILRHNPGEGDTILVRDQMGGRGAVWYQRGSRLWFASEVRHLLPMLPTRPPPDEAAMAHWLAFSGMPGDRTLYQGVHRLRPAHVLRVGASGGPTVRCYWQPVYRRPAERDVTEAARELRGLIVTAAARRSDGRAGVLLSGGLDSASVAAAASTLPPDRRPVRAYSAVFPRHPSIDESQRIGQLCAALGLRSTRIAVRSGSVIAGGLEYLRQWHLPPVSPNLFFWFPLLRAAAGDGVGALLDGEGGDELFGLSPYLVADRLRRGQPSAAAQLIRLFPGGGPHVRWPAIRAVLVDYGLKGLVPARLERIVRRARGGRRYVPAWLTAATTDAYRDADESGQWKKNEGPRWWAYLVDATTRGMGPALTYDHVRRRAALCGLEARHPLVDVDVVEFTLSLAPELAYDTRWSRPVLRTATDGLLPDEVRLHPGKSVFDGVFNESLAGPDLAVAAALLDPATSRVARYVDLDLARRQLLRGPGAPGAGAWWAARLWRVVTAECWLRIQDGSDLRDVAGLVEADVELSTV